MTPFTDKQLAEKAAEFLGDEYWQVIQKHGGGDYSKWAGRNIFASQSLAPILMRVAQRKAKERGLILKDWNIGEDHSHDYELMIEDYIAFWTALLEAIR